MHTIRNAIAALLPLPCILLAEPPVEWRAELSSGEVATLYASHGDTRAIECRLFLKGSPYVPGLAAFRYGTNGFAGAGWEAPVAISSNLAAVAWSPALDPGADMLALLLTLDGTHTAKALLHLRPGPAPGDALPPPTQVLDFAAIPYTNAPWALAADIAAMHPDFEEWAAPTYDRIVDEAVADAALETNRLDALARVGVASGYALRALRSHRSGGMVSEDEIDGAWALVAETDAAVLTSNVLQNTTRAGLATVEFTPADGTAALRASVDMPGDAVRTTTVWPAAEATGTWRELRLRCPAYYSEDHTVTTSRWNGATYVCTNWTSGLVPAWYTAKPGGGGLVGIAPHYALSAAHCGEYGPRTWATGASSGRGTSIATFGDLRLLRMPNEVPERCRAKLLRASVLAGFSPSLCFRAIGAAHTQHGAVAPCLLEPRNGGRADLSGLSWDAGWTCVGARDEWRNATWAHLRPFSHAAHAGDSGHPVWFQIGFYNAVPVGLFHSASGSGECLLSDALLDTIDDAVRRDSGGAESLAFYTAEDLQ